MKTFQQLSMALLAHAFSYYDALHIAVILPHVVHLIPANSFLSHGFLCTI